MNCRLLEKMVIENWVKFFIPFLSKTGNSLGRRCSNLMKIYINLGNVIASTFFINRGQKLTMRQVIGQIRVKSGQFGSKVHSILKMMQNEENRPTSVILDKSNGNTISMALVRGQVLANI